MTEEQKDSANYVRLHHNYHQNVLPSVSQEQAEHNDRMERKHTSKVYKKYGGKKLDKWHEGLKKTEKGKIYDAEPTKLVRESLKEISDSDKKRRELSVDKKSKGGKAYKMKMGGKTKKC
jgi:hypothetical protein